MDNERQCHVLHVGRRGAGNGVEQVHHSEGHPQRQGQRDKDVHGQWCIEPCELHRVYPEQKALLLETRVVDLEADRNAWREQAQRLALTSVAGVATMEKPVASWWRRLRSALAR